MDAELLLCLERSNGDKLASFEPTESMVTIISIELSGEVLLLKQLLLYVRIIMQQNFLFIEKRLEDHILGKYSNVLCM